MAINVDDLVVLEDQTVGPEEESMLELFFPQSFYVVGTEGNFLTTMNNLDIFHRVLGLFEGTENPDEAELREEIAALTQDADELSQEEYDETVERESTDLDEDYEDEEEDWDK